MRPNIFLLPYLHLNTVLTLGLSLYLPQDDHFVNLIYVCQDLSFANAFA